jgi:hypothetical protein
VNRVQIYTGRLEPSPEDDLARRWFRHRFANEPEPVEPRTPVGAGSLSSGPPGVHLVPDHYGSASAEPPPAGRNGGRDDEVTKVQPQRFPGAGGSVPGVPARPPQQEGGAQAGDPLRVSRPEALIASLAAAQTVEEFTKATDNIAAEYAKGPLSHQRELQRALLNRNYFDQVARFLGETASADLAEKLTKALFGPKQDLGLSSTEVIDLINGPSFVLARHLATVGFREKGPAGDRIAKAWAERSKQGEAGAAEPRPQPVAGGGTGQRRFLLRRIAALSAAGLLLLVAAFFAGGTLLNNSVPPPKDLEPKIDQLQASVNEIRAGQGGTVTPPTVPGFPWSVNAPQNVAQVAVLIVDRKDGLYHGKACQRKGDAGGFATWTCDEPQGLQEPGVAKVVAFFEGTRPPDLGKPVDEQAIKDGVPLLTLP